MSDASETRVSATKPKWGLQPGTFATYLIDLEDYAVLIGTAYVLFQDETGIEPPDGDGAGLKIKKATAKMFSTMRQSIDPLNWAEVYPDDDPDCPDGEKIGRGPTKLLAAFKTASNGTVAETAGQDLFAEIRKYTWPLVSTSGSALTFIEQVVQVFTDMRAFALRGGRLSDARYPVTPATLCTTILDLLPVEFEAYEKIVPAYDQFQGTATRDETGR